ncbi:MAG TPA: winged helix-turn-helix domain-containing protein [Candidatus Nitrosotalea sp.]|nr:winged helix-turn-helix domain-containing protein [Candidatus Nitrosotalea sp.]
MKYRGRIEIIAAILESARSGNTKTKIMYEAYLSHDQVSAYIELLKESDLLHFGGSDGLYRLTERGLKFLNAALTVNELMNLTKIREGKSSSFPGFTYVALKTNAR